MPFWVSPTRPVQHGDEPAPAPPRPGAGHAAGVQLSRLAGRWSVGAKFFLILAVLGVSLSVVITVGLVGLERSSSRAQDIFADSLTEIESASTLHGVVDELAEATQALVSPQTSAQRRIELAGELHGTLIPRTATALELLAGLTQDEQNHVERVAELHVSFRTVQSAVATLVLSVLSSGGLIVAAEPTLGAEADAALQRMAALATEIRISENAEAQTSAGLARTQSRSSAVTLIVSGALSLVAAFVVVLGLIRNLVPRIRRYSHFAAEVAAGRPPGRINPRGSDELARLGRALDDMVDSNARRTRYERTRQSDEKLQAEFVDALQIAATEDEAHHLVQRHIERFVPDSAVTILTRNNSADRLQSATPAASSVLADRLADAEPRSCLAIRVSRMHLEGTGQAPLLGCTMCTDLAERATCEPLVVGGEVIGSVLVTHSHALTEDAATRIKTTVAQVAPVLANLRNLALAEFRANNDSLTGLPNKRATETTLKRMVAQANRSVAPLAAVMFDLDHFKQINDQFGHGRGDDVLAAVGSALQSCMRASDFAGRFGGEEFLILLPDTTLDSALIVAEKIRTTVATISVPDVERKITASLGLAALPDHAGDADRLIREADRALYAAKSGGRNRTVSASHHTDAAEVVVPATIQDRPHP